MDIHVAYAFIEISYVVNIHFDHPQDSQPKYSHLVYSKVSNRMKAMST